MKLFDFQLEFVDKIHQSMRRRNKRVVGNLITGGGKTVVGGYITRKAIEAGSVVCILVHREEILAQFAETLRKFGILPGMIIPGNNPMPGNQVYLGMIETFNRRMKKDMVNRYKINFFILDEVHWGSYPKVINEIKCHILGLTATPKSTGNPELNEVFDDIVIGANVQELILINRLVAGKTHSIRHDFSKVKKKGGEFDDKDLLREFKDAKLYGGGVENYMRICPDRKAICYCPNIQWALDNLVKLRECGIKNLFHIDGKDAFYLDRDKSLVQCDRTWAVKEYKNAEHAVMTNVGIATTGFDDPSVSCIIEDFATMSLTKHHQVLGRGARAYEGKKDFIIIDMGRNWLRHGRYGQVIDWEGIFREPKKIDPKAEEKARKIDRECEECGYVMPIRSKTCPSCLATYTDKEVDDYVREQATAEEIKQHKLDSLPIHLRKPLGNMNLDELREYGRIMGWKPNAANIRWGARQVWLDKQRGKDFGK